MKVIITMAGVIAVAVLMTLTVTIQPIPCGKIAVAMTPAVGVNQPVTTMVSEFIEEELLGEQPSNIPILAGWIHQLALLHIVNWITSGVNATVKMTIVLTVGLVTAGVMPVA